ncbi:MAG: M15 family metallopeptidase [Syntrophomonadaceae bacterium]|nr:M15 family metallopeptidase [Syntrophomonadaceae bacterium]
MSKRFSLSVVIGVLILVISVISVKSVYLTAKPTVDTAEAHINEDTATLEGMIHNTGGRDVSCYGFRWGTSSGLDKTENLSGSIDVNKPFSTTITGLKEGVTYYYRAFAVNAKGTAYGDIKSFTVPVKYNAPPIVSITSPGDSMTITPGEVVKISASATDDKKVESMELYINNIAKKKTDGGALTYIWDTSGMDAGKYVIKATAGDGVKADEKTINITVKDDLKKVAQAAVTPAANKVPTRTKTVATPSRGVNYTNMSSYPRLSQYNGSFGQFYYRDTGGGAIEIDPRWIAENIVTIKLPGVNRYVQVHKNAKDNFIQAFTYIQNGTATINGKRVPLLSLVDTIDGTFVSRHVNWNPSEGLSNHSWGIAIDINADNHFRYVNPNWEPDDPNYILWVKAFQPAGFSWGNSYGDSMHYEVIK